MYEGQVGVGVVSMDGVGMGVGDVGVGVQSKKYQ